MFNIMLCCYESIDDEKAIKIKDDIVEFTGNNIYLLLKNIFFNDFSNDVSDCTNSVVQMYFDRILIGSTTNEKFNLVIPYLQSFMNGETVCVIAHGITGKINSNIY